MFLLFYRIEKAFKTLFFALYLIGDSKVAVIEPFKNSSTMNFGYLIYATFHIANITILMSMLIAMMTKSYENIIVINLENNKIFKWSNFFIENFSSSIRPKSLKIIYDPKFWANEI